MIQQSATHGSHCVIEGISPVKLPIEKGWSRNLHDRWEVDVVDAAEGVSARHEADHLRLVEPLQTKALDGQV